MELFELNKSKSKKVLISDFAGLSCQTCANENEFTSMRNMACSNVDNDGTLSTRDTHNKIKHFTALNGISAYNLYVDNGKLIHDNLEVAKLTPGEKQLITMENNILIFPDKLKYSKDTGVIESLESAAHKLPSFTHACIWYNRLWLVSQNEVHASKLGDPAIFDDFSGLSTDSYTATVEGDEPFTAITAFGDELLIMREHSIECIYGSNPSSFRIAHIDKPGIGQGFENSSAIVNNKLIYLSQSGVMCYERNLSYRIDGRPDITSQTIVSCVATGLRHLYYLSIKTADNTHTTYVYNSNSKHWYIMDNKAISAYTDTGLQCYVKDNTLYSFENSKRLSTFNLEQIVEENTLPWHLQTPDISLRTSTKKSISRIDLCLCGTGTYKVEIAYDTPYSEPQANYTSLFSGELPESQNITLPLKMDRCHHARIRLSGVGECTLLSMVKTIK